MGNLGIPPVPALSCLRPVNLWHAFVKSYLQDVRRVCCLSLTTFAFIMPLDINLFRADSGGNPDVIRESQRRRFASVELVDEIIAKDEKWRKLTGAIDNLRKERNTVQKEVATFKKSNQPCDELVAKIKSLGDEITAVELEQKNLKIEVDRMVNMVGNLVDDSVPVSQDEDAHNLVVRKWGTPRDPAGLLSHHDLLWRIGGYEPERGAAIAGHRGYFLKDAGVLLNQAFINYGVAFLRKRSYSVLQPPFFMKKDMMAGVRRCVTAWRRTVFIPFNFSVKPHLFALVTCFSRTS
jgi:seryl-tRNA synthetase